MRSYLAEQLQCDPMRITKKYSGPHCLGKRVFHPCEQKAATVAEMEAAQRELDELHQRFLARLQQPTPKEERQKAAASVEKRKEEGASKDAVPPVQPWKGYMGTQLQARAALMQALSGRKSVPALPEVQSSSQVAYTPYPLPGYSYAYPQPTQIVYSPPQPVYSYVVAVPPGHSHHVHPHPAVAATHPHPHPHSVHPPPGATQYIYHHPTPHVHASTGPVATLPMAPPPAVVTSVKHPRVLEIPSPAGMKRPRTVYAPSSGVWETMPEPTVVHAPPTRIVYTYDPTVPR